MYIRIPRDFAYISNFNKNSFSVIQYRGEEECGSLLARLIKKYSSWMLAAKVSGEERVWALLARLIKKYSSWMLAAKVSGEEKVWVC